MFNPNTSSYLNNWLVDCSKTWLLQLNSHTNIRPSSYGTVAVCLGLGKKTTWLGSETHHGLGLNHYITSVTSITNIPMYVTNSLMTSGFTLDTNSGLLFKGVMLASSLYTRFCLSSLVWSHSYTRAERDCMLVWVVIRCFGFFSTYMDVFLRGTGIFYSCALKWARSCFPSKQLNLNYSLNLWCGETCKLLSGVQIWISKS